MSGVGRGVEEIREKWVRWVGREWVPCRMYGGGQGWKDILLLCSTWFDTAVSGLIGTYSFPLVGLDFF